ncbi:hypothetical protein PBAL39_12880 [Pedobacter sp. BAL39]|nr:hypothetical protein PBAL39_12880 [Pedobacter sp. BAL39]
MMRDSKSYKLRNKNITMMKILLTIALVLGLGLYRQQKSDYVYICISETAVAYHKTRDTCKGIKACNHQILKVTKEQAMKKYKYRACKLCYR